jgi:hypothetical protein
MVDQLLGGLFGGQDTDDEPVRRQRATDFIDRYERGRPYDGIGDDEVIQNYQTVAGRLSPQEYEEAAADAFGRLSREERRELRRRMRQQRKADMLDDDDDDPRSMARELSQYRQQGSDDPLGGLFGGGGGLGGMLGGMLGGGGGSPQASGSSGDLLGGPLGKAVLGGVAAYAMKRMMGGR